MERMPFRYCQEWSRGKLLAAAEDLRLADQGLPLHKILSCAEEIKIPEERGDILRIPGSRLSQKQGRSAKIPGHLFLPMDRLWS